MNFGEKLQFLMTLTNTSNSALAKNTALDASYISRLKNGNRKPVPTADYLKKMALFFSKRIDGPYMQTALGEALFAEMGVGAQWDDLPSILLEWLQTPKPGNADRLDRFLIQFSNFSLEQKDGEYTGSSAHHQDKAIQAFQGVAGKRTAVLAFLSEVLHKKQPMVLQLFSDENMSWLSEDPAFAIQWSSLLKEVLLLGCRIRIIHNINRDLDELLTAINKWLPLYMTGTIEPFFYPKVRDGLFQRTLFVAPSVCAVVSTSIGPQYQSAANLLFLDPVDIASFEEEFEQYLMQCKPLMTIHTQKDPDDCIATLMDFERPVSNAVLLNNGPSLVTMPKPLLEKIMIRHRGSLIEKHLNHHQDRFQSFLKLTKSHEYIEILQLADEACLRSQGIPLFYSEYFDLPSTYYEPDEYLDHLEHMVHLLEANPHYHVYLAKNQPENNFSLYVKENIGTIVAKSGPFSAIFALNQPYLTGAFWDYLKSKIHRLPPEDKDRAKVMESLRNYVKSHR